MKANHKTGELLAALSTGIWAIQPEHMHVLLGTVRMALGGDVAAAERALEERAEIEAARRQQISASTGGSVVVLRALRSHHPARQLDELLVRRHHHRGLHACSLRQALADPNVTAIVIDVDSPGGCVSGVDELASEIFAARSKKTIIAISNTLNASAAYYLSSQASELVRHAQLAHRLDRRLHRASGHLLDTSNRPASRSRSSRPAATRSKATATSRSLPDAQAAMQKLVDGYYAAFVKAVARGRKSKPAAVKAGFGEGRVVMAQDAIDSKMADKIGTLDTVLARFGVQRNGQQDSFYGESETNQPSAETEAPAPIEAPAAAKKDSDADEDNTDDVDDNDGDDVGPCACDCDSCKADDCSGCTTDDCDADGCTCKADKEAKAKAEHDLKLHLQRRRIALAG